MSDPHVAEGAGRADDRLHPTWHTGMDDIPAVNFPYLRVASVLTKASIARELACR